MKAIIAFDAIVARGIDFATRYDGGWVLFTCSSECDEVVASALFTKCGVLVEIAVVDSSQSTNGILDGVIVQIVLVYHSFDCCITHWTVVVIPEESVEVRVLVEDVASIA